MKAHDYRVLLFCPNRSGHHTNFARIITEAFARVGVDLHVAATNTLGRYLETELDNVGDYPVQILSIPDRSSMLQAARLKGQLNDLHQLTELKRWDRIVIPAGDGLLQVLGLANAARLRLTPTGIPIEALMLRGSVAYPSPFIQHLKHRASWRLVESAPVSIRHHLDPIVVDWLKQRGSRGTRWRLMPDPIEVPPSLDKREARAALGLPPDGAVIGCAGELSRRKGIHLLLEAFQWANLSSHVRLFLAGTCAPDILKSIERLASSPAYKGRIHLHNRWLTDSELRTSLSAMDLVAVTYPRHTGSASIALRAMAAQRPIIGSESLWIARHVRKYAAGWVCDVEQPEALQAALEDAMGKLTSWKPSPLVDELLHFNSPENFMRHWIQETVDDIGCSCPGFRPAQRSG